MVLLADRAGRLLVPDTVGLVEREVPWVGELGLNVVKQSNLGEVRQVKAL
jgi:hypothetical protein